MNYIKLAKQTDGAWGGGVDWTWEELEAFVKLVAAHEREECAKLCEEQYEYYGHDHVFAKAIRARGEV